MRAIERSWGCVCLLAVVVGCGPTSAAPDGEGENGSVEASGDDVGKSESAVQWNYGTHYWVAGAGVWSTSVSPAIGIAYVPVTGAPGFTAPCGVTFVSRHFAITAAHCVDKDHLVADSNNTSDPGDATFRVSQFDTSALSDWNAFQAQAIVTGTGPFYNTANAMSCTKGYCASGAYSKCRVRYRCSSQFGKDNCPASIGNMNGGNGVDIAMIHCADRPSTAPYVRVDTAPDQVGPNVQIWWYHEVKYLATDPNVPDPLQPSDNWEHYGHYDGTPNGAHGMNKNYHYTSTAQPFLLTSKQWPSGAQYFTTATGPSAGSMWSDAYACHGTSGSGVFINGTARLLGPVINGSGTGFDLPGEPQGRLCMNTSAISPRTNLTLFVAASVSRQLEAMATSDR
jgi:hypothetical protein